MCSHPASIAQRCWLRLELRGSGDVALNGKVNSSRSPKALFCSCSSASGLINQSAKITLLSTLFYFRGTKQEAADGDKAFVKCCNPNNIVSECSTRLHRLAVDVIINARG